MFLSRYGISLFCSLHDCSTRVSLDILTNNTARNSDMNHSIAGLRHFTPQLVIPDIDGVISAFFVIEDMTIRASGKYMLQFQLLVLGYLNKIKSSGKNDLQYLFKNCEVI